MSIDAEADFATKAWVGEPILAEAQQSEEFLLWIVQKCGSRWEIGFFEDGEWFDRDGLRINPIAILPLPPPPD